MLPAKHDQKRRQDPVLKQVPSGRKEEETMCRGAHLGIAIRTKPESTGKGFEGSGCLGWRQKMSVRLRQPA